jgi:hypothetical protein
VEELCESFVYTDSSELSSEDTVMSTPVPDEMVYQLVAPALI